MTKKVKYRVKTIELTANALLPRKYRSVFGRDLVTDMQKMAKDNADTTSLENLLWIMLRDAGEDVGDNVEEWLESMEMLDVYQILPDVLDLWIANQHTTSTPKKK